MIYSETTKTNKEPTGTIEIIKRDCETGQVAQGNATLLNAKYEIYAEDDIYNKAKTIKYYSKGQVVATRIMKEDGTTDIIDNLPIGKYIVKEVVSSEGYLLDKTEHKISLEYANQNVEIVSERVTSLEVVKKMQVHIFKSGIKEHSGEVPGLQGAEFTIKLYSDVQEALNAGYSYEEIWNGVNEYGNSVKVDSNRIKEAQDIAPSYEVIVTDSNGNAYTESKLPYGKYIVKETKTPKDFESASDFTFSITQDESEIQEIAQKVKHIVVNNEQLETYIKLIKKDKDTGKTVTLNSATFEIKATQDIYDRGNGKLIYKQGENITQKIGSTTYSSFTTNADNIVVPDNSYNTENDNKGTVVTPLMLEVGSYEITEINTPIGYLQLEQPIQFKVEGIRDYDKDQDGDYIKEIIIENEKPTGTLIVDKSIVLRENVDTSLIDVSDLSEIQFKLTVKEDIIDYADGSVVCEKGTEIGTYNLDINGDLKVEDLMMGIYELQEIKTLNGLVLSNTKYEVKFTQQDTIIKVYEKTKEIENHTTVVEFSKQDITGEKELEGAVLTVIDKNGEIIDSWTSTNKPHTIEGLKVDKEYTLREDLAPIGYAKATDIKFKVENTNELQKVVMIDKIVEISKIDFATGEELPGAELMVTDTNGNIIDKWISTEKAHQISGLEEGQEYILTEILSPYGYAIAESIVFKVTTEKDTQTVEMVDKPIVKSIKVIKIDKETNEIIKANFEFGIYEDAEGAKLIKEVKADKATGTVIFEELVFGTYYIKETKAPKGYQLSNEVIKIEISEKGVFANEEKVEEQDKVYSITYYNEQIPKIQTGNETNYAIIIGSIILSLVGITTGIVVLRRKNK